MWGFQLWANLPACHKMMDPRYRDVRSDQIPLARLSGGVEIKVICGEVAGVKGPVQDIVIDPEYLDFTLPAGTTMRHATKRGHTVFAYVSEGSACFDQTQDPYAYEVDGAGYFDFSARDCLLGPENVVLWDDGDGVVVSTADRTVRFLLISGKPIGEPVAWYGPIVMNTQQELRIAFQEYQDGTFIKHGKRPR